MNSVIFELDEVFMHSTPDGWKFSGKDEPEEAMTSLRVEIEALDRDDWDIGTIWTVTSHRISEGRWIDKTVELTGKPRADAIDFLDKHHADLMQEKVDFTIIPDPYEERPYSQMVM